MVLHLPLHLSQQDSMAWVYMTRGDTKWKLGSGSSRLQTILEIALLPNSNCHQPQLQSHLPIISSAFLKSLNR